MKNKSTSDRFLKLHMELTADLNDEYMGVLKKYGKVEKSISRDVLIPAEMPLYCLHFVIQRAFGWRDSHAHHFIYPDSVFTELTGDNLIKWSKLCGIYFRFPFDDELFWDGDDPDDYSNPKTWLRRKYTAPYDYCVPAEDYVISQTTVDDFIEQNHALAVPPDFEEFMSGRKACRNVLISAATVEEGGRCLQGFLNELLERLPAGEVISCSQETDISDKLASLLDGVKQRFDTDSVLLLCANELLGEIERAKEICTGVRGMNEYTRDMMFDGIDDCADALVHCISKSTAPEVFPLADTLIYEYDYGDGWEIRITCTGEYSSADELDEQTRAYIDSVIEKRRPICIAADGLNVTDDAGGIDGYVELLKQIHGADAAEKEEAKEWLKEMGWTGRLAKPENIL